MELRRLAVGLSRNRLLQTGHCLFIVCCINGIDSCN